MSNSLREDMENLCLSVHNSDSAPKCTNKDTKTERNLLFQQLYSGIQSESMYGSESSRDIGRQVRPTSVGSPAAPCMSNTKDSIDIVTPLQTVIVYALGSYYSTCADLCTRHAKMCKTQWVGWGHRELGGCPCLHHPLNPTSFQFITPESYIPDVGSGPRQQRTENLGEIQREWMLNSMQQDRLMHTTFQSPKFSSYSKPSQTTLSL